MRYSTGPRSQSEHFRAKAAECLKRSMRVQDAEYQRLYQDLACQWLVLAHEAKSDEQQKAGSTE